MNATHPHDPIALFEQLPDGCVELEANANQKQQKHQNIDANHGRQQCTNEQLNNSVYVNAPEL